MGGGRSLDRRPAGFTPAGVANAQAYELSAMSQWLTNIQGDDYGRSRRLAFPAGVCDYGKPSAGQNQRPSTWLDYGDS